MKKVVLVLTVVALLGLGVAGLAQAEIWNFSTPPNDVGSDTHSYDSAPPGVPIVALAQLTTNGSPGSGTTWTPGTTSNVDLFGKSAGVGETGLGLSGQPSNEIQNKSYIRLDLNNLITKGFTALTMSIGSIQTGEGYSLWENPDPSATTLTLLRREVGPSITDPGDGIDTFTLPLNFGRFLYVSSTPIGTSGASDVLIDDGANAVPLPPSVLLMGSGLLGLAVMRLRRRA